MYFGQHTQVHLKTSYYSDVAAVLWEASEWFEWEDSEWELMESVRVGVSGVEEVTAEFPCHYYGDYTCELTANRPDSLCPFHAGEED